MKKTTAFTLLIGTIIAPSARALNISATGGNSPSAAELNGDIIYSTNTSNAYYHTINNFINDRKLNPLQKSQLALLVAEHPTKLSIDTVTFVRWAGDSDLSLTLTIKNTNNLPASAINIGMPDQKQTHKSNRINFIKTKSRLSQKTITNLTLDGNAKLMLPLASLSEIVNNFATPAGYCLYGASTSHSSQETGPTFPSNIQGSSSRISRTIPIVYTYTTIFDQKYLVNDFITLMYANRTSDFVLINGEYKKLECLN